MRPRRLGITTGGLLVLVALAAGNCAAWRFVVVLPGPPGNAATGFSGRFGELFFGLLPAINVALLGLAGWVLGWSRPSGERGEVARDPASIPALTYFCLHFLAIGFLFGIFMPGPFTSYRWLTFVPAWELASRFWPNDSLSTSDSLSTMLLESSLFILACSGPILVASWVGRRLAVRLASTRPGRPFRRMTALAPAGFAAAALAIVTWPQPFRAEDGVALTFRVVEADSNRPILSAFVRLVDPFDSQATPPSAFTDAEGRARLVGRFPVEGESNLFRAMGAASTWGRWLEVSAPGHQSARFALSEVLTPDVDFEAPAPGRVALAKGPAPEPAFGDIAGSYWTPTDRFVGQSIEIKPDGQFAWRAWGCMWGAREFGEVRRDREDFILVTRPAPCQESSLTVDQRFRAIPWGDGLYFSSTDDDDLQTFCRAAFARDRRAVASRPDAMRREAPLEEFQDRIPRLPARVWVGFALREANPWNEGGSLRLALLSVLPRGLWSSRDDDSSDRLATTLDPDDPPGAPGP